MRSQAPRAPTYADALQNKISREALNPTKMEELRNIIENTSMTPVIINKNSKFVMVTYWWGRGNLNKNTQWPCPFEVKPGQPLDVQPIKYEDMIDRWIATCVANNCNYMVQEYPEFAKPGGYQMAINAKPLFINKALDVCKGFGLGGVVYIDGDMTVNKYPAIFDIPNVDFMARGWNIDPRATDAYVSEICFDPIVFETSGGTMYFADTRMSRELLRTWFETCNHPIHNGKADDRILSLIFMTKHFYMKLAYIQLPIEYLWLTDLYTPRDKEPYIYDYHMDKSQIVFEHAACLTSEEAATEKGAASNRQPRFYYQMVEEKVFCQNTGGIFYEFIFFPTEALVDTMQPYLGFITDEKDLRGNKIIADNTDAPYKRVTYTKKYGKFNDVVKSNLVRVTALVKKYLEDQVRRDTDLGDAKLSNLDRMLKKVDHRYLHSLHPAHDVGVPASAQTTVSSRKGSHEEGIPKRFYARRAAPVTINAGPDEIVQVLYNLAIGNNVVYVPANATPALVKQVTSSSEHTVGMDFVAVTTTVRSSKAPFVHNYMPKFHPNAPMYFSHTNKVLYSLISMCKSMAELEEQFVSSHIFLSRIRCHWIKSQ
jgi:hypothetical protein